MRKVRLAVILVLSLSAAAFAQPRPLPKNPEDRPTMPDAPGLRRCCTPKVLDSTGKEIGELIRWDDRIPSWPHQAWVRYELKGGDAVVINAGAESFFPITGIGGSAVVFTSTDCSGDAFVNQLSTPTMSKRYAAVLTTPGSPGPWASTNAWLYVTDPFPARVSAGATVFRSQWDYNGCVPYPSPFTFSGPQYGFWMKRVEDLYAKFKRPYWVP